MNILLYLQHKIDGFSSKPPFISNLKNRFKNHTFIEVYTTNDLKENLSQCDLLITWVFKVDWYINAPQLRAIFTPAAGSDWVEQHPQNKVPIFHGTFHGPLLAEMLLLMMLYFNKQFRTLLNSQHEHIWDRNTMSNARRLGEQNVIIFGYGSIGRECARMLKGFGCKVTGVKHSPADPFLDCHADVIVKSDRYHQHLCKADHIVGILPGNSLNDGFFGREFWSSVNPAAFFYNIGRGNSCREKDLLWALNNKKISGAALDVFEQEPLPYESKLWNHPNILVMPHSAALCKEYMSLYIPDVAKQLKPFLE